MIICALNCLAKVLYANQQAVTSPENLFYSSTMVMDPTRHLRCCILPKNITFSSSPYLHTLCINSSHLTLVSSGPSRVHGLSIAMTTSKNISKKYLDICSLNTTWRLGIVPSSKQLSGLHSKLLVFGPLIEIFSRIWILHQVRQHPLLSLMFQRAILCRLICLSINHAQMTSLKSLAVTTRVRMKTNQKLATCLHIPLQLKIHLLPLLNLLSFMPGLSLRFLGMPIVVETRNPTSTSLRMRTLRFAKRMTTVTKSFQKPTFCIGNSLMTIPPVDQLIFLHKSVYCIIYYIACYSEASDTTGIHDTCVPEVNFQTPTLSMERRKLAGNLPETCFEIGF